MNAISLKKTKRQLIRINIGLVYTIIGLILFLNGSECRIYGCESQCRLFTV
ncbi:DUF1538 family protein [Jeotgalibaca porci]|uniref:DUF1538 family protein n=1 Tax=Jeotgalibaca porci TaxID=1868793 RepID=A0A6G7WEX7_9LACT|nr:DUF1538 family protein [Jeotgalibaca porci]